MRYGIGAAAEQHPTLFMRLYYSREVLAYFSRLADRNRHRLPRKLGNQLEELRLMLAHDYDLVTGQAEGPNQRYVHFHSRTEEVSIAAA